MPLRARTLALAVSLPLVAAPNAQAIVGGNDASPGEYPFVAHVVIDGLFSCTGTLVTPTKVVTAAHCGSLVAGGIVNVPIGQPGQLIDVTIGSLQTPEPASPGSERRTGTKVDVHPEWLGLGSVSGDVAVVTLDAPSSKPPVKVAGTGEESIWSPGTLATIAGYGVTQEGGDQPALLQEAQVPIVTDDVAAAAYPDTFETRTQLGAGFPQGGVDTCQGDSGGPLLAPASTDGPWRLVGDTSYGEGCARKNRPGIYGRLGAPAMREWLRSVAPDAIAPSSTTSSTTTTKGRKGSKSTKSTTGKGSGRLTLSGATLR